MDESILISAMSLFAGVSLMPAVSLILRDKEIPLERNYRLTGGTTTMMALLLLALSAIFLLNAVAQDLHLLLALIAVLVALPLLIIRLDKCRRSGQV